MQSRQSTLVASDFFLKLLYKYIEYRDQDLHVDVNSR